MSVWAYLHPQEAGSVDWDDVENKPPTFPSSPHTHSISDTGGLQTALDNKITVGDSVPYSTITGAPSIPNNTNQLTNGAGFVTSAQAASAAPVQSVNGQTGVVTLTIPAAQVNSDWNAVSGITQVLNKPDLSVYVTTTALGTTLSSYVTSSSLTTTLNGYATTTALNGKFNTPAGTNLQYVRGDGSLATFPTIPTVSYPVTSVNTKTGAVVLTTTDISEGTNLYYTNARVGSYLASSGFKKVDTYLGVTNSSGDYVITFPVAYATAPDVQAQIYPSTTANQTVRVTAISTTGATIRVEQRNAVTVLGLEVLLAATTGVNGANVSVQVTSRS